MLHELHDRRKIDMKLAIKLQLHMPERVEQPIRKRREMIWKRKDTLHVKKAYGAETTRGFVSQEPKTRSRRRHRSQQRSRQNEAGMRQSVQKSQKLPNFKMILACKHALGLARTEVSHAQFQTAQVHSHATSLLLQRSTH
jgi:hypothetical protein